MDNKKDNDIKAARKITFLGLGKMAGAMLNGIIARHIARPEDICGFDISPERTALFSELGIGIAQDAAQAVSMGDVIVIAVKPQSFVELFDSIRDAIREDVPIISIAAGVPISRIKQLAGKNVPVVRVIPNNPMLAGEGMSVMAYEPPVTEEQAAFAEKLFSACGRTVVMGEEFINPSIAIHSSSPAYIYLFARAVAEYAEGVGIDQKDAVMMFAQTLIGSGRMIERSLTSSDKSPLEDLDELIAAVRSPGGTTAASLDVFGKGGFRDLIKDAMNACTARAEELGSLK